DEGFDFLPLLDFSMFGRLEFARQSDAWTTTIGTWKHWVRSRGPLEALSTLEASIGMEVPRRRLRKFLSRGNRLIFSLPGHHENQLPN
ncbi:MAG: hypothetical protein ACI4XG_28085, partial [Bradyrhizobium sp.]